MQHDHVLYNQGMEFYLYTDGACQPNPGQGGWAFILCPEESKKRIIRSGYEGKSTNNRMEITAVLEGLKQIISFGTSIETHSVTLYTDSKYVLGAIDNWMYNWFKSNWLKKSGKSVVNDDLWKEIHTLSQNISIKCIHVKG